MAEMHQKQNDQIELWLQLVANLADSTADKPEAEITKKDIVKIARKINDIVNVLYGKSKISGWRIN
jgi:hypothetical protein